MCGIVGYIGRQDAAPIVLEGLTRLEHRGYDSAGVAVLGARGIRVAKQAGRVRDLVEVLPKRFAQRLCEEWLGNRPMRQFDPPDLARLAQQLAQWPVVASGTEGYRTAEVTLGGVDTNELSSSTMESRRVEGLYFIGECVDVTGWLGGYNFQWAWASADAAGRAD